MRGLILPVLAAASLGGCQSLTPQQTGQLVCVLASDGATVAAVYKPGVAPKASATAQVACDAGTQVGAILGASK